jgi:hypothetical protein
MDDDDNFKIYSCVGASLSIFFSACLLLSLNKMKSNYAKTMRHIVISECIFIFCELMVLIDSETDSYNQVICNILSFVLFNIYSNTTDCSVIKRCNYSGYFGMQAFSIWLNVFICFELILILKNPIAQMQDRFRKYYLSSILIGLVVFSLSLQYSLESYRKRDIFATAVIPM